MKLNYEYHKSPKYLHVNCESPRAYFIPYADKKTAFRDRREDSDRFISLCGEWDFKFYKSFSDFDETDCVFDEKITVPMSWQLLTERGYDVPQYTNVDYPFPFDPPNVPDDNPCGLYSRNFYLAPISSDEKIFINFEGVDCCFYLFLNGKFAAYSQVSHTTSEINVTGLLKEGENNVRVLVLKWCDGSYLEDQDKYRLSGIFREVYLLKRNKIHIRDVYIKTKLFPGYKKAQINIDFTATGEVQIQCELYLGGKIISGKNVLCKENASLDIYVENPELWSDENPVLYKLLVFCGEEFLAFDVGLREISIDGRVILINGKKVKAKGINRHDTHPELGAAPPLDHMLRDLILIKRHNMNMVRTSHYPNDPRFYSLCDRLGIYVCDEADIETHGAKRCGVWDYFTDGDDWTESYLDRVRLMFERDKNHPSIIMWSLGNENGVGKNQVICAEYLRSRGTDGLIHSADVSRRLTDSYEQNDPDIIKNLNIDFIDVESRMYPSFDAIRKFHLDNKDRNKPLFLCEYGHSMGNSPGDIKDYWDIIYANDSFFGGCIWEFADHSINIGTHQNPRYTYGGDFGEFPHDGNFCVDGMVYPDRRPHTGLLEYKEVLKPIRIMTGDAGNGKIILENKRCFTGAEDIDLYWNVEKNGEIIADGRICSLDILPQGHKEYTLYNPDFPLEGICALNLFYRQNRYTKWAPAGFEIGCEQLIICEIQKPEEIITKGSLRLQETDRHIIVRHGNRLCAIDKKSGLICDLRDNGKKMLSSPVVPNIWRAPTDNDRKIAPEWIANNFDKLQTKCYGVKIWKNTENLVGICADISLGAGGALPVMKIKIDYIFDSDGKITLSCAADVRNDLPMLPRFGFEFKMPSRNEKLRYFGRGPHESYIDKKYASTLGEFSGNVSDEYEPYIKPQENMAHADTEWMFAGTAGGHGVLISRAEKPFSFNCSHYSSKALYEKKHAYELIPSDETIVNIDLRQSGIGSGSCGPALLEKYRISEKHLGFSFEIRTGFFDDANCYGK